MNIIDAVVVETEKFSRSQRNEERDGAEVTLGVNAFHTSIPELLRPEMDSRQVKTGLWQKPWTSVLEAECSLGRE